MKRLTAYFIDLMENTYYLTPVDGTARTRQIPDRSFTWSRFAPAGLQGDKQTYIQLV